MLPGRGRSVSSPWSAQAVGSAKTATSASRPATSKTASAGTVISSAKPPSLLEPMPVRLRHRSWRPRRHWSQRPQLMLGLTVTHWPGSKAVTSSPADSTVPTISWPGTSGNSAVKSPSWMCLSVPQSPVWWTRIWTSFGPGSVALMSSMAKTRGSE